MLTPTPVCVLRGIGRESTTCVRASGSERGEVTRRKGTSRQNEGPSRKERGAKVGGRGGAREREFLKERCDVSPGRGEHRKIKHILLLVYSSY